MKPDDRESSVYAIENKLAIHRKVIDHRPVAGKPKSR
jgi:hypothetical protein